MFSPTHDPRSAKRSWREAVRRAVDLAVAFATLEALEPRGHDDDLEAHPHRLPLRAPDRARRPGVGAPRPQHCVTPLAARPRRRHVRTPSAR